jgi:hypothetical protein
MSEIKNMVASVRDRLLRIAKLERIDFDKMVLLYMQERYYYSKLPKNELSGIANR